MNEPCKCHCGSSWSLPCTFKKKFPIKHLFISIHLNKEWKRFLPLPSMRTHLAFWSGLSNEISPHLWGKRKIYFIKVSVIAPLSSFSDTSLYVLEPEMFKTHCKNIKMKAFASSQSLRKKKWLLQHCTPGCLLRKTR